MTRFDLAHWDLYNARQTGRAPRQLCRSLLVLAVDPAPGTADLVPRLVPPALRAGLEVRVATAQEVITFFGELDEWATDPAAADTLTFHRGARRSAAPSTGTPSRSSRAGRSEAP